MLNTATSVKGKREERPVYSQRGKRASLGQRIYNMTREKYGNSSCVYPPVLVCNSSGVFICEIVATYGMVTTAVLYDMTGNFFMEFTATSDSIIVPQDRGAAWIGVLGNLLTPFTEVIGTYLEERESGRFDDTSYLYTQYLLSITEVIPELSNFVQIMASTSSSMIIKKADFCRKLFRLGTEIPDGEVFAKTEEKMGRMIKKLSWGPAGGTTAPKAAAQQQEVQKPKEQAAAPVQAANAQSSPTAKPVAAAVPKLVTEPEVKPEPKSEKKPEPEVKAAAPVIQETVTVKVPEPVTVKPVKEVKSVAEEKPVAENKPVREEKPVREPEKPRERGVSVLESAVPGLLAYNTALSKLKGKGLFHILVFTNGDAFFSSCLEREVEILHEIGILESTECLDGGNYQKGKACVFGSVNAAKALQAVEAGAYAFFCGSVPKEIRFKANVFDISGAGAAVAENWLTQAGMEIGCDMSKVLKGYPGWDKIPEDEFVNNTVMKHFTLNPDVMKIQENDFEWIKEWVPSLGGEDSSIIIKSDTISKPAEQPEIKAQPVSVATKKVSSEPTWDEIEPDFDEPDVSVPIENIIKSTVVETPLPGEIAPVSEEIHEEITEEITEEIPSEDDALPADEPNEPIISFDDEPEEPDFGEPDFDEPEVMPEPPKAVQNNPVRPQEPVKMPQQEAVKPEAKQPAPAPQPAVKKTFKSPGSFKPKMGILNQVLNKPGQQSSASATNTSAEKKEPAEPPKTNGPITPQGVEPMPVKTEENKEVEALAPIEAYTGPVEIFSTKEELEQREENAKLFDAIMAEHEHVLERIQERGTAWHDRLRRGYEKAVSNNDYKFYGASFCNTEYGNGASDALVQQFYKSPLYLEVYNSEMRVRDKVAKIRPVKRGALCMNCRHKFEADITTAVGEATEVTCPSCGRSVRITLVCDPDGGENG